MDLDMNNAEPQKIGELIPDGTIAKVTMFIRPGGIDGLGEFDRGLLKASNVSGSDVVLLDAEFTVPEGPHARRKFWQMFTVAGGKVDENGESIGWKISKSTFRAMIDSALGLDPNDMSEPTKAKRMLRGLADLSGITLVGKIKVEPSDDSRYQDSNKLDRVLLPNEPEWKKVMDGEALPPSPSKRARQKNPSGPVPSSTAWAQSSVTLPSTTPPAWNRPSQAVAPQPTDPTLAPKPTNGPAWLKT